MGLSSVGYGDALCSLGIYYLWSYFKCKVDRGKSPSKKAANYLEQFISIKLQQQMQTTKLGNTNWNKEQKS